MNAGKSSWGGVEHNCSVLFNKGRRVSAVSGSFAGIAEGNSSWGTLTCVRLGGGSGTLLTCSVLMRLPRQPRSSGPL